MELANIFEVIDRIAKVFYLDMGKVKSIKVSKKKERGGFEKQIVLQKVIERELKPPFKGGFFFIFGVLSTKYNDLCSG